VQGPGEGDRLSFSGLQTEQAKHPKEPFAKLFQQINIFGWLCFSISFQGSHEGAGKAVGIPSTLHEFQAQTIDLHRQKFARGGKKK